MIKRKAIYAGLLIFVAAGVLIDWYFWKEAPPSFTANDLAQMVGIILLTSWWQIADARLRNAERSGAARTLTILLAPVGLAVYLFQTRSTLRAAAALAGFLVGVVLSLLAGDMLGMALFADP